jgi:hypothetical protein
MHTCKLRSTAQAAPQSTLIPGTDPARLKLTTCTCPRPTSPKLFKCTHDNDMHWGQAQERHTSTTIASGATRAPSARKRPTRTLGRSSSADRRLDLQQVLRGLSRRLQPRECNGCSGWASEHSPQTISSGNLSKASPDAMPALPRRSPRRSLVHVGRYTSYRWLQGWQLVAQAKGLHSAVEGRALQCAVKRDCARDARRRRKRKVGGRSHRHWALFSCTEMGSQK